MKNLLLAVATALELTHLSASIIHPARDSKTSCGLLGYDQGTESFYGSSEDSYAACSAKCLQYSTCKMFAIGAGECQLYDTKLKQNWIQVSDSPYAFYERACISTKTSATSALTTTKTGTTTSAKVTTTKTSMTTTTSTIKTTTSTTTSAKATTTKASVTTTTSTVKTTTTSNVSAKTTIPSTTPAKTTGKATSATSTAKTTVSTLLTTKSTTSSAIATSTASQNELVCGQNGYMGGSGSYRTYVSSYEKPSQEALSECYNYCNDYHMEGYCAAWSWFNSSCALYAYVPAGNFEAASDDLSYVWDTRCATPFTPKMTTTTSSPTTTTSTEAATPLICGVQGKFLKGSVGAGNQDTNYGEMTQEALTECAAYCLSVYACNSWTWLPNQCQLWHSRTERFTATDTAWYFVWDVHCPAPAMSDTVHTSTTTTVFTAQPTTNSTRI